MTEKSVKTKRVSKRKPQYFNTKDLRDYVLEESEKTGKSKEEILEETFHDGYIVISESADGAFKVEGGQLFKPVGEKVDDLTECRRLRERFGPISACVEYIKDVIMGSGFDIVIDDFHDERQRKIQKEILEWMDTLYQDVYTVGLNSLLDILVDNALTEGFAAAEIVYMGAEGDLFNKYAKPLTSSVISQEGGKLAKSDYTSYEISDPLWEDLKGIARLKIFLDAPTRLRLYRRGRTWEADYWVLDQPNVAGSQGGMVSSTQKNLQQGAPMQLTSAELVASTMPNASTRGAVVAKPSAYFLPWQIFSLSLSRRTWLEKGPSIILPAMKTAQLLEKIMNAVGEGIYRAGNKKYFIICGSKDRPWGAIHIRNLLSQIKDASEKNWSTIPVPAGFDLKEAGGQVFEAQNAINYFLRVIAGIMHVNPSVLGLDTREARNVTEYPYFTHLRMREQLKNQVRTQLVRLQIWAKYGQKRGKQGGYVDPQWIPQLRTKTEDLLNPADRLKLDIDILNSANPVMPQTKLEIERDIVITRGWEVDLPTQEDFMKDLKKQEEEAAKAQQTPPPNGEQPSKTMGPPSPPSEEKQQKRLQNSTNKSGTAPKQPPRGSTRKPTEVQEAEALTTDARYKAIKIMTNEQGLAVSFYNPFTAKDVAIVRLQLHDGLAGFNEDETKIYVDSEVPDWMMDGIVAHETFERMLMNLGFSYEWSHVQATQVERMLCKDLGIDYEKYDGEYHRLLDVIDNRKPKPDDPEDMYHGYVMHRHKNHRLSKKKKVEESLPNEPQKLDVNINVTAKAEPIKTEKQEVEVTVKQAEPKPQEPTKIELSIKNEPIIVKTEKQEIEVKIKEDEEKKVEEKEIRDKKRKILDEMEKKVNEEVEPQ
jgi:hypothetical protein